MKNSLLIGIGIKITFNHTQKYALSSFFMRIISIDNDIKNIFHNVL